MGRTFRRDNSKEANKFGSNKNAPKKLNKEKRPNNKSFKNVDYKSDYD